MAYTVVVTGKNWLHSHGVTLSFDDSVPINTAGKAAFEHMNQLGFKQVAATVAKGKHVENWLPITTDDITGGGHG